MRNYDYNKINVIMETFIHCCKACNHEFPYFVTISQYISTLFTWTESYLLNYIWNNCIQITKGPTHARQMGQSILPSEKLWSHSGGWTACRALCGVARELGRNPWRGYVTVIHRVTNKPNSPCHAFFTMTTYKGIQDISIWATSLKFMGRRRN